MLEFRLPNLRSGRTLAGPDPFGGLEKALDAVVEADGRAIVVSEAASRRPLRHGRAADEAAEEEVLHLPGIAAGILLKPETTTTAEALECYTSHTGHSPAFIHAGFADTKRLVDELQVPVEDQYRSSALSTLWT